MTEGSDSDFKMIDLEQSHENRSADHHNKNAENEVSPDSVIEKLPQHYLVESNSSTSLPGLLFDSFCDACPYCVDTCSNEHCQACIQKIEILKQDGKRKEKIAWSPFSFLIDGNLQEGEKYISTCELKRHNNEQSAWLLCGNEVFDATEFIRDHPGGKRSILRKAGGKADCTRDMEFHSKQARKLMKQNRVGILVPCSGCEVNISSDAKVKDEQCVIC